MGKKGDLSDFERGMVVGFRRAGQSISKTADLLGFSLTTISRVYREWSEKEKISSERQLCGRKFLVDVRGQRRMDRLVRDDRKATVTQITTHYNQGVQNIISERTTRWTLKQMGSSSRRPHRVPLLSAKNRKQRLQFAQAQQNWTIEDWKNVAWSDESRFLLRHSDGRVRIWRKEHESMDPSCLVSTVQAGGGVMVWGIFSWHNLGPLVPIEHRLNATAYLSIVADHVHPFMTTVYLSSDRYFQQDNAPRHKAQTISDWFLEHDGEFTLLTITFGMWWNGRFASWMCSRQICSNCVTLSCQYGPKSLRNVSNTLLNLCHEELRQFWRQSPTRYSQGVPNKMASECIY